MTTETSPAVQELIDLINSVRRSGGQDVLIYNGELREEGEELFLQAWRGGSKLHDRILVIMSTPGGDPAVAYRMAIAIRHRYTFVSVLVVDICKSAGTLFVLGADRLVMLNRAELGPLDVQLRHHREVGERTSGLTVREALNVLDARVRDSFTTALRTMVYVAGLRTELAAKVAADLVVGAYSGIYGQIDPIVLASSERAQKIASAYGERLVECGSMQRRNLLGNAIRRLTEGYPSHDFVIDQAEAKRLFGAFVEEATVDEERLASCDLLSFGPNFGRDAFVVLIATPMEDVAGGQEDSSEPEAEAEARAEQPQPGLEGNHPG